MQGILYFSFQDIQMRSRSLTRDSLCISPHHSPSLLSNKRKHTRVLFLVVEQAARLGTKLAALNNHRQRRRHHLCLKRSIRSGSRPCRRLGSHPDTSLARVTPRNHTRQVDRDGMRPTMQHGDMLTPLTPRDCHHLSSHDNIHRIIAS